MAALVWLLIPFTAAVAAGVWGGWAARRRTALPDSAGVAGYERFRTAMERTHTSAPPPPAHTETTVVPVATDGPAREAG